MIIRKVDNSARMVLSGQTFNAMAEVVNASQASGLNSGITPAPRPARSTGLCRVKNNSGADCPRFAVLTVTGTLFSPATNLEVFCNDPVLTVSDPTGDDGDRLVILQEPIAAGGLGVALLSGLTVARVYVNALTDMAADVTDGETRYLDSGTRGPFTILSPLTDTGQQWVVGKLGGGSAAGTAFAVNLTQTGGSATAGFTYTVTTLGGTILATGVNPTASPHRWRRPSVYYLIAATAGLAHLDAAGTLCMDWINEVVDQEACRGT